MVDFLVTELVVGNTNAWTEEENALLEVYPVVEENANSAVAAAVAAVVVHPCRRCLVVVVVVVVFFVVEVVDERWFVLVDRLDSIDMISMMVEVLSDRNRQNKTIQL
jgi:hypothetical protein